jgi:hypothetical protein
LFIFLFIFPLLRFFLDLISFSKVSDRWFDWMVDYGCLGWNRVNNNTRSQIQTTFDCCGLNGTEPECAGSGKRNCHDTLVLFFSEVTSHPPTHQHANCIYFFVLFLTFYSFLFKRTDIQLKQITHISVCCRLSTLKENFVLFKWPLSRFVLLK